MGKLSYNDKLHMQMLWQVAESQAWFTQNDRDSAVDSSTDFLNSAQLSPFVSVTGKYWLFHQVLAHEASACMTGLLKT